MTEMGVGQMKFYEKLNLLMSIQKIPNNKLARVLSVDPSLVSRWRNGTREIAHNSDYIHRIAEYLATHVYDPDLLYEILDLSTTSKIQPSLLSDRILLWFQDGFSTDLSIVNAIISKLNAQPKKLPTLTMIEDFDLQLEKPDIPQLQVDIYLGNEGKKQSVLLFLNSVLQSPSPVTLLLYSDEPMEWLAQDSEFSEVWAKLLLTLFQKGHKIKIIHTINRSLEELLFAIDRWLPVYMIGAVEPYYLPTAQESCFKRTLFVAPGHCAVSSSAIIGAATYEQLYYESPQMVSILENEFMLLLKSCRPLMKLFSKHQLKDFTKLLYELENETGDLSIISQSPSFATLPAEILHKIKNSDEVIRHHQQRYEHLLKTLEQHHFFEWLCLPLLDESFSPQSFEYRRCDCFLDVDFCPTFKDYVAHIEQVIHLLKTQHHYQVILIQKSIIPENILIIVKKSKGVIVCKMNAPEVYIAFNHPIMVSAFQKFIEESSSGYLKDNHSRALTQKILENWVDQAKNHPLYEI